MTPTPSPTPTPGAPDPGGFYVHLADGPAASGFVVTDAADALEAAMLFAERQAPGSGEGPMLQVHVVDGATGERCCFWIDMGTGEVGPC
jgi:hypothetical protein